MAWAQGHSYPRPRVDRAEPVAVCCVQGHHSCCICQHHRAVVAWPRHLSRCVEYQVHQRNTEGAGPDPGCTVRARLHTCCVVWLPWLHSPSVGTVVRRCGTRYGLRQLAGGLGPVVFSTLYKQFDKRGGSLPYFPQAPFYFGVFLLIISIGFAISLPNPVKDLGKEQARFIARRRACSIPTYLPSTPRTPVRTFMPRRASTGLYGRNLKFAPDGSQSGSGAASNIEDSLSAASPLLTRTPQGDSAAFARDVDSAVDDVLDRRARRGELYGRSHSPVSAGERARSGSRNGLLPPTVHRQRTAP